MLCILFGCYTVSKEMKALAFHNMRSKIAHNIKFVAKNTSYNPKSLLHQHRPTHLQNTADWYKHKSKGLTTPEKRIVIIDSYCFFFSCFTILPNPFDIRRIFHTYFKSIKYRGTILGSRPIAVTQISNTISSRDGTIV